MLVCKGFIDIDHRLEYYYIFLISIPPLCTQLAKALGDEEEN